MLKILVLQMWAAKSGNFYNFGGHFVQILSDLLAQACGFDADKCPFVFFFETQAFHVKS